jgi:hypothetical protein
MHVVDSVMPGIKGRYFVVRKYVANLKDVLLLSVAHVKF